MAKIDRRLTAITVSKITARGMYPDGCGLYLRVGPTGAKAWVFRFQGQWKAP